MAAKGTNWSGRLFVWVGESVRPAYDRRMQAASAKAAGGPYEIGAKAELLGEFERKAGALFVSQRKTRKLQMPSGAGAKTEQRTGKEHAAWTRSERCIWGCKRFLFTDMREERARSRAQGEWQSEMAKRNGKAKWQSEMAKRNGKSGMRSKAHLPLSHGPGGLRQSLRELREFGCWCLRRFRLNK
jgi:hypothetical protein